MTASTTASVAFALFVVASSAAAQPPARPAEPPRSDPSRSVTLSLTEYNRLVDLARQPQPAPQNAPVGAVLASANLRVRVDRDTAHGVFDLTGDVLRPGIQRVPLISGATLIEGRADGQPLPLTAEGTTQSALLPGPGPFAVTLEWGAPLTYAPGRASFLLPVPPAGAAHATIDLPGEQADVHLSSGVITRRSATNGRTTVEVALRPGTPADVWWSMRDSAPVAAAREVRMLADVFTLVTLGDSDVRMAALVDLTVVQGEPKTIEVQLPGGYDVSSISGATIESSANRDNRLVLTVSEPSARQHQFLIGLERTHPGGSFKSDTDFVALPGVQRERGEIGIEGVGTLELDIAERTGMHRIDVRELNGAVQSLAHLPLLSAFRYQRSAAADIALAMDVRRFADAGVLAAIADRAVATTLITSEGRALTQVELYVRNRAQPFLKVTLPSGGTIVSVEVAGESAKPVVGADGTRVPLLRPGFSAVGVYTVSYVYLQAGAPLSRKGELQMALPKMDIPVGIVEWEVFVPDRYAVHAVDGNVIRKVTTVEPATASRGSGLGPGSGGGTGGGRYRPNESGTEGVTGGIVGGLESARGSVSVSIVPGALPGQIRGSVRDRSGAALPGTTLVFDAGSWHQAAVSAGDGTFLVSGVPNGMVTATARLNGFGTESGSFVFDQQTREIQFVLAVPTAREMVRIGGALPPPPPAAAATPSVDAKATAPSQNVINLQRRAAGVLPIRVDVPRAGAAQQFVKPLVVDQEAFVIFRYKQR